jgi:DNA-binding response OmpR family regulator
MRAIRTLDEALDYIRELEAALGADLPIDEERFTPIECALLRLFAARGFVNVDSFNVAVYGDRLAPASQNNLCKYVVRLRRKTGVLIRSIHGHGYRCEKEHARQALAGKIFPAEGSR